MDRWAGRVIGAARQHAIAPDRLCACRTAHAHTRRHGLRSWRPWAASLGVELLSQYMLGTGHAMLQACGNKRWPPGSTLYSLALLRGLTARRWGAGTGALATLLG